MDVNHLNNAHSCFLVSSLLVTALLSIWCMPTQVHAQTDQARNAGEHIQALKQGVLIFGVPDQKSKINFLQRALSEGQISKNERRRMDRLLHQAIMERDSFQTALSKALEANYSFSDFMITNASKMEVRKDSLLQNWTGQGDSSYVYMARLSVTESGADALIISDSGGKRLTRPFPYYVRITRLSAFFDALLGTSVVTWKDLNLVIEKLDKKLHAFYARVNR